MIDQRGYGDTRNEKYAGYCGIGEMWATFQGDFYFNKYATDSINPHVAKKYFYSIDKQWYNSNLLIDICCQAMHGNGYTSSSYNISLSDLFSCLTPDTHDLDPLITNLLNIGVNPTIIENSFSENDSWK